MYLLDTDTLLHVHAGHPTVAKRLQAAEDGDIGTTIVSAIELLKPRFDFVLKAKDGAELLRAQKWLHTMEQLLSELDVIGIDSAVATGFDKLRAHRNLRKIGRADLLIASIALAHEATLVTRNLRDFRQVPGLNLVNWVD